MKKFLALATLIAALAPVALAPAAQAKTPRAQQIVLSTADLDVSQPADAAILITRIESALRPFCVENTSYDTVSLCMRDQTHKTVRKLGIPAVKLALEQRMAPAVMLAQR